MDIAVDKINTETAVAAETAPPHPALVPLPSVASSGDARDSGEDDSGDPPPKATTEQLTAQIQNYLDSMNINVSFSTYGAEETRTCITVTEKETGKVIRQIPPKELQRLHSKMEELIGMIFNEKA